MLPLGVPKVKSPKLPPGRVRRLESDEEQRLLVAPPQLPADRAFRSKPRPGGGRIRSPTVASFADDCTEEAFFSGRPGAQGQL